MVKVFFRKPQIFFFGIALVTLLVAVNYFYYYPEAYFDLGLGGDFGFSVSCSTCWFTFSLYTLLLSGIYYTASKGGLRTRHWMLMLHFIFVILFLLLFYVFSSFNTPYVQDHISGIPFLTLMVTYGVIFLLDLIFFVISLILLLINILSFKKPKS